MTIAFTEATGGPVPKIEIEINLTSSGSTPDASDYRDIYIMAERVAAGTSTANAVSDPFGSVDEAIAWFGANSPGAVMAAMIYNHNCPGVGKRKGKVYGACVAEHAAGVAATQTLTFATAASGTGYWTFRVGGHDVSISVASGDTPAAQAIAFTAAYAALPAHQRMPLTVADNGAGVCTLTASVKGAASNLIGLTTVHNPGVATTATWGAAAMAAGDGYPDTATLLTAMASTRAPIIVVPWDADGWKTEVEDVIDYVNTQSDGTHMMGSTLIYADVDSASALAGDADNADDDDGERVCLVGMKAGGYWSGELAAKFAAIQAAEPHLARSLNGLAIQDLAPPSDTNNWTVDELEILLEGGVTPLYVPANDDQIRVVRAVSIRTEYGTLDFALMPVLDYVRDDLNSDGANTFSRASIVSDDTELPDVAHVVQPKLINAWAKSRCLQHQRDGYLTNVEEDWPNVEIEWDEANTVSMAIPTTMIPQLHNIKIRMDQEVG